MVGLEENIKIYTEEFLKDSEYFIVDVVRGSSNKKTKISVFIDSDTSVAIEKCAEVSRYVTNRVDEEMEFEEPYTIEVSSAGLDRPLQLKRQYLKNVGRDLEVLLNSGEKLTGTLTTVNEDSIVLLKKKTKKTPEEELIIENNSIKVTKIIISF